jgi:tricorn protease
VTAAVVGRQPLVQTEDVAWSPDGRYLAYVNRGTKGFSNVWIVPAAGGEPQAASFLANGMARTVAWHPQGQSLYFLLLTAHRAAADRACGHGATHAALSRGPIP